MTAEEDLRRLEKILQAIYPKAEELSHVLTAAGYGHDEDLAPMLLMIAWGVCSTMDPPIAADTFVAGAKTITEFVIASVTKEESPKSLQLGFAREPERDH